MSELQSTVLVVEDDDELRGPVTMIIGRLGYRVVAACAGEEALRIVENDPDGAIAVLFTDVQMPGRMDGFELARRATAIRPALKVIYTTGAAGKIPEGPGRIVAPIIHKPYRTERLAAELRRAFDEQ
jgi:CheY-like chemotaxis protein